MQLVTSVRYLRRHKQHVPQVLTLASLGLRLNLAAKAARLDHIVQQAVRRRHFVMQEGINQLLIDQRTRNVYLVLLGGCVE